MMSTYDRLCWIPCSIIAPKENGSYEVTVEIEVCSTLQRVVDICLFSLDEGWMRGTRRGNVVAWRHLIPYQGHSNDESKPFLPIAQSFWNNLTNLPTHDDYLQNDGRFVVSDGNRSYEAMFDIYETKQFGNFNQRGQFVIDKCIQYWTWLPSVPRNIERGY